VPKKQTRNASANYPYQFIFLFEIKNFKHFV
jgi:hypothetical protein